MVRTWDDLIGVNIDRFYTFDDPLGDYVIDLAFAAAAVVRDGPSLTVDWSGTTDIIDGLDALFARDDFVRGAAANWGTSTFGQPWTVSGTELTTDGTQGLIAAGAVNTLYTAVMGTVLDKDFDFMVRVKAPTIFVGAKGSVYLFARWTDVNNHTRIRIDFNTDQILGYSFESVVSGVVTAYSSGLVTGYPHTTTDEYWIRFRGYGSTLWAKAWTASTRQPDDWNASATDPNWTGTVGAIGLGFMLQTGNTNTLPYTLQVKQFMAGMNDQVAANGLSFALSLDDGLPSGVSDTSNLGVGEAGGSLYGPIGTSPGIYFSPFRTDQPWADIDRDTPGVAISSGVVTRDGLSSRRMFTGQMADIVVDGIDSATLKAVSANRVKLRLPVQPPAIHGYYEGAEATWLVGYALFKAGLLQAPPLVPGCRYYAPMNGSLHTYIPDNNNVAFQNGMVNYPAVSTPVFQRPTFIDGPFPGLAAPDTACGTAGTRQIATQSSTWPLPPGDDFWSRAGNKGRIEYWIRGDPINVAGSNDPGASLIANCMMVNPGVTRYVQLAIPANTRIPYLNVNDGSVGATAFHNTPIPTDGKWHFVAASWNIGGNNLRIAVDGTTLAFGVGSLSTTALPLTDDITSPQISAYLPMAQLRVTSGKYAPNAQCAWAKDLPWTSDVVMRRSLISFESIAQTAPQEAYGLITSIAQGELAWTGFDAADRFQYLPLSFWGEAEQQLIWETLSSDTNLSSDLRVRRELTQIYNQIVLRYRQSSQDEVFGKALELSQLLTIPSSTTTVFTFAAARPLVEPRGLSITVMDGSTLAGAPPTDSNFINYITLNDAVDGSGTYATSAQVIATISYWDPGTIQISIQNLSGTQWFLSNDVNIPPLGIAGKMLQVTDASVTAVNSSSLAVRGPRVLPVDLPMTDRYTDALGVARELAARLGYPQVTFSSPVFGDARRQPGQLVTLQDTGQTNVSGTFRVQSVSSSQEGPDLQQVVTGIQAKPILVWGVTAWGESIYGEAIS